MAFLQSIFTRPNPVPVRSSRPAATTPEGRLAEMFEDARSIVVLTGAGLSTGSGIPAYRDADGFEIAPTPLRHRHFLVDPEVRLKQWRRSLADARAFAAARPNDGHAALAKLARTRKLKVVTQNVDGLHARAGMEADALVELHGQGDSAACLQCGSRTPLLSHAATVDAGGVPVCERDGGMLKPAVCLFGEAPLRSSMMRAEEWARDCDLFLVVGTSLTVTPAGFLPNDARHSGAKVVVVNRGRLARDVRPDLVVEADAAEVLASLPGA